MRSLLALALSIVLLTMSRADSQGPADSKSTKPAAEDGNSKPNVAAPTLGGRLFWGDVVFFRGWRIQQHVETKHFRLLDPKDTRHAWGTLDECRTKLKQIRESERLEPMSGKAVILIHGIGRSSKSMTVMQERLAKEELTVVPFDYPSTRIDIPACSNYLRQVIANLDGIETIHLVCHSLGGLVARTYLTGDKPDDRIGRLVMLGTPHFGAELADKLQDNVLFRLAFGPAGQQLTRDEAGFLARLPVPRQEFGIIAGGRSNENGFNPLIPGDDDGTVSVSSTRLPGAHDFLQVNSLHTLLLSNAQALDATSHFLREGRFSADREPEPIPPPAKGD